jgi:hypothetical protein
LKELISETQAEWIVAALAVGLLLVGPLLAWNLTRSRPRAAFTAALGPILYLMWRVYNGIVDSFGLDSVNGLLLSLVLFLAAGSALGLLYRRWVGPTQGPKGSAAREPARRPRRRAG